MICAENPSVSCIKTGCLIRINIYLSQSFYAIYLYCDDIISNNIVIVGTKNNVTTINSFSVSFVLTTPSLVLSRPKLNKLLSQLQQNSILFVVLFFLVSSLFPVICCFTFGRFFMAVCILLLCNVSHSCISLSLSLSLSLSWLRSFLSDCGVCVISYCLSSCCVVNFVVLFYLPCSIFM